MKRTAMLLAATLAACGSSSPPAGTAEAPAGAAVDLRHWGSLPPAALAPEPPLPEPAAWPFGDAFPRTSGTGRYHGGAYFWSDFLYDDHGALDARAPPGVATSVLSGDWNWGVYRYPEPDAAGNGADIFRAAIGLEAGSTVWRVDWNTLVDPALPIAAFALDTDADPATGTTAWPANAGLESAGIEWAILLSSQGAQLIDLAGGTSTPLPVAVDSEARSFLVRVPRSLLPVGGTWTVRLAAGLADAAGTAFRTLDAAHGASPGEPNAYNLAYRDYADEPAYLNPWHDRAQATALGLPAGGEVSAFSARLDWARLEAREIEPEPLIRGRFVDRWFVSSIEPHQGIRQQAGSTGATAAGLAGTRIYGSRVQPYALYLPTGYSGLVPAPLTLILHASAMNHNVERQLAPRFAQGACEDRGSICLSPLGRGQTLYWEGVAELDAWEAWNRVATGFRLDPQRTVVGGHSGGGAGAFNFAERYPDLFAGFYIINSLNGSVAPERKLSLDLVENLRWNPAYHMDTALDELPPFPVSLLEMQRFEELGYRYVFDIHVVEDHFTPALKDDYRNLVAWLGTLVPRKTAPGRITYRWYPQTVDRTLGIGPRGAWWLQDVAARDADAVARIDAQSAARPEPAVTPRISIEPNLSGGPSPALRRRLDWEIATTAPARRAVVELELGNVGALTIDLDGAGLLDGEHGLLQLRTDGPTDLRLASARGTSRILLQAGSHRIAVADGAAVAAADDQDVTVVVHFQRAFKRWTGQKRSAASAADKSVRGEHRTESSGAQGAAEVLSRIETAVVPALPTTASGSVADSGMLPGTARSVYPSPSKSSPMQVSGEPLTGYSPTGSN